MDMQDMRRQLNERYLAEKVLNGASAEEIADDFGDPVAEIEESFGTSKPAKPRPSHKDVFANARPSQASNSEGVFGILLFLIIVCFVLEIWFIACVK